MVKFTCDGCGADVDPQFCGEIRYLDVSYKKVVHVCSECGKETIAHAVRALQVLQIKHGLRKGDESGLD